MQADFCQEVVRATLYRAAVVSIEEDHDTPFCAFESTEKHLGGICCTRLPDDVWLLSGIQSGKSEAR